MAEEIPSDADLMFIEAASTGTVHIAVQYRAYHLAEDAVTEVIEGGSALVAMAISPTLTRCGKRTFPQFERDHLKTTCFRDEQLCRACYRTLAAADQERAFEHETPDGDEDDEPEQAAA
ncbi:hypothetical protein SAMN06272781_6843 [Streptomyces sp. 1222.2]|uniref:hypothetical protein n=1 Tax=Streptomyces sp. 1222.2 TaxID=1938833 RepID=UPI000BDA3008|nr:hypothetical protein [Streptomyces sp. 1222.2]SOD80051.1 hypothetical protein SAMN06272781_6843 [Streptomyces sp. 1222.2]